jgi:hypothetical protein
VRSITGSVFDCSALDREVYARSHLTALKSHGASKLAMAARATRTSRADEACTRLCPLGSGVVHLIVLSALDCTGRGQV